MTRRKLSPSQIVERLRVIETLIGDGHNTAGAIRLAGVLQVDYDQWRSEYAGLLRTLGPLAGPLPRQMRKPGGARVDRAGKTVK